MRTTALKTDNLEQRRDDGLREQAVKEYRTVIAMDVNSFGAVDSTRKYLERPYKESE